MGAETVDTVPAGTTWLTTGTDAIRSSASVDTGAATGCSTPVEAAASEAEAVGMDWTGPVTVSARDETELVMPPNRDEESGPVSAVAAVEESVSQVTAAAPARSAGRRARHGELMRAMRTTPQ